MFTPLVYWNYSGWFSDFRSLTVGSRVSHLQLVSGRWFPGCSAWWGSVALDHHSIQRSVYPRLPNKSLPVPVCLAPQIHNLPSRSSPPFFLSSSPLLLPRRDPPLCSVCKEEDLFLMRLKRAVFPDRRSKSAGARLISHKPENGHSYRSLFSLCPLSTCWLGNAVCLWLTNTTSIWLAKSDFFIHGAP